MKDFNLSRWALEHKSLVVYLMLIIALAGVVAYGRLGREEDPLEELPNLDYLKSYSKPGESVVFVTLKDATPAAQVPDLWYQARKKVGDIKKALPQGIQGPFFNDEFGDTYSLIFALTSDAASPTWPRSISSVLRTRPSTWSSPPTSSPLWGSTFQV